MAAFPGACDDAHAGAVSDDSRGVARKWWSGIGMNAGAGYDPVPAQLRYARRMTAGHAANGT